MATVTSTAMCQDQTMGAIYLSTVTTPMGLMNLEAPSVVVGHWGVTIEELMMTWQKATLNKHLQSHTMYLHHNGNFVEFP